MLVKGQFSVIGIKKAIPQTELVRSKLEESYPLLKNAAKANYFVEI